MITCEQLINNDNEENNSIKLKIRKLYVNLSRYKHKEQNSATSISMEYDLD